ncbi:hypothetical protein [Streptomyces sp. XH2]|uniref:hypothetical protein n=1 Tax=Streptomyces sp. XH2 TaxID=3412483 RepID=UPI003C7B57C1
MRIEVSNILDSESGKVEFHSPAGTARGFWKGPQPALLGNFDVEIEVPEVIHSWDSTGVPGGRLDTIESAEGEIIHVSGTVEHADEDPVISLRIHSDIVLVELDAAERPAEGSVLAFTASAIDLYPYLL